MSNFKLPTKEEAQLLFHSLDERVKSIQSRSAILRAKRDDIQVKIDSLKRQQEDIANEFREIELPLKGLVEDRSNLSKFLSGRVGLNR